VEERKEKPVAAVPTKAESVPKAAPATPVATTTPVTTPAQPPTPTPPAPKAVTAAPVAPALALPNLANVDLAKISSILSSLTSVMKSTGVSPASRPSPGTPSSPTALTSGLKTPVLGTPAAPANPLANILSKVEITPESILSALSKTQTQTAPALQGLSSLLQSVAGNPVQPSEAASQSTSASPAPSSGKGRNVPPNPQPFVPKSFGYSPNSSSAEVSSTSVPKAPVGHAPGLPSSGFKPPTNSLGFPSSHAPSPSSLLPTETSLGQPPEVSKAKLETEPPSPSLEMKIHNFLKGNPGFSGLNLNIPILSSLGSSISTETHSSDFQRAPTSTSMDNVDGTPVRDERSGTPTQDEMMDKPTSSNVDTISLLSKIMSPGSSTPSSTRSPLQSRDDGYSQDLPNSVHTYRPFGLGRDSPAGLYKSEEIPSSLLDSSQEKFYPDTSFQEDEDYRDFDYSGPPPSAMLNLEKKPAKSILKSSKLSDSSEYQPVLSSYGQRAPDFGVKSSFPQSMRSILDPSESRDPLASSPAIYGSYGLRGSDSTSDGSPSPGKNDVFFTPDSNHNNLPKPGLSQKQYPDSSHSLPHRSLFSSPNTLSNPAGRAAVGGVEKSLASSISATSTMEFKNMLKNASRKPSEEKHFPQLSKSSSGDGVGLVGASKGEQQPQEEHFRIETRVSSSCLDLPDSTEEKGAPIETLGYHNASSSRGMSGEPIQTVESIRVLGKGSRGHGREAGRAPAGWFELSGGGGFDNGPSGTSELPGMGGFPAPYKDHVPPFQESVNNFRTNNFSPAFEHHLPPPPPPLAPPPLEHGTPFPRDPVGPPSGPPPPAAKDHGGLFPRDHSVPPRMPAVDHANPFSKETSSSLSLPHGVPPPSSVEHAGVPFPTPPPPPPPVPGDHAPGVPFPAQAPPSGDAGGVAFPAPPAMPGVEHGAIHQGTIKEHFPGHPPQSREAGPQSQQRDHGASPLARSREPVGLSQQLGGPRAMGPPPHRDGGRGGAGGGGGLLRTPRAEFRPREPFVNRDPFHSLKRPRPPFARGGAPFFTPKRPFFPPR
ncbi:RPRD2 protein, partial [Alcedo cyanopectus]|nr:RPRD2 protein [Ceyx cyanopectus]